MNIKKIKRYLKSESENHDVLKNELLPEYKNLQKIYVNNESYEKRADSLANLADEYKNFVANNLSFSDFELIDLFDAYQKVQNWDDHFDAIGLEDFIGMTQSALGDLLVKELENRLEVELKDVTNLMYYDKEVFNLAIYDIEKYKKIHTNLEEFKLDVDSKRSLHFRILWNNDKLLDDKNCRLYKNVSYYMDNDVEKMNAVFDKDYNYLCLYNSRVESLNDETKRLLSATQNNDLAQSYYNQSEAIIFKHQFLNENSNNRDETAVKEIQTMHNNLVNQANQKQSTRDRIGKAMGFLTSVLGIVGVAMMQMGEKLAQTMGVIDKPKIKDNTNPFLPFCTSHTEDNIYKYSNTLANRIYNNE